MSLQWFAVASFLYLELFLAVLLMLPFISALRYVVFYFLFVHVACQFLNLFYVHNTQFSCFA